MLSKLNLIQFEWPDMPSTTLNYKVLIDTKWFRLRFNDSEVDRLTQATICIREAHGSKFDGEIGYPDDFREFP
jgi:hypothetical protein